MRPKLPALPAYLKQVTMNEKWKREERLPKHGIDWNTGTTCPAQVHMHREARRQKW